MNKYIKQCYKCSRMIYSIFNYTDNGQPICSNCINEMLEKLTKENKYMEEEIQDKLEKIYNDYIRIEVRKFDDKIFEIEGHIKIRKGDTISLYMNMIKT